MNAAIPNETIKFPETELLPGEGKQESSIAPKFEAFEKKATSFAGGLKQSLGKLAGSSWINLTEETSEFAKLLDQLGKLNKETAATLFAPKTHPPTESDNLDFKQNPEMANPRHRATEAVRSVREISASRQLEREFSVKGILGDADKIEGHQIDFIYKRDKTVVNFKMTEQMNNKFANEVIPKIPKNQITESEYSFQSTDGETATFGDAWVIRVDENTSIYISKGGKVTTEKSYDYSKPVKDEDGNIVDYTYTEKTEISHPVRSLDGAVQIEIKGVEDVEQVSAKIEQAFGQIKISDALSTPDQAAVNKYKEARFRWQHRLENDNVYQEYLQKLKREGKPDPLSSLNYEEVFPEYFTIVDPGASDRYQADGSLFLIHRVYNDDNLASILKNGLLSSHERYKRGIFTTGMSTQRDFQTGGADNVFLRIHPESADSSETYSYPTLLIDPRTLDRTDWFAYNLDEYGTTEPETFNSRPSAETFFANQRENFYYSNEIMVRRGVAPEMIKGVVVSYEPTKENLVRDLQAAGINEVNGTPISEFIKVYSDFGKLKDGELKPKTTAAENLS